MDIEIGAQVRTSDGHAVGQVHRVVIDLEQQAVTGIVVLKGRLLPRDILVPLDFIASAEADRVGLMLSRDELDDLPNFAYNDFFTAPPTWGLPIPYPGGAVYIPIRQRQRMSTTQEDITPGLHVRATDADLGTVDRVELNAAGHLEAFWVGPAGELGHDLRIPIEWVESIDDRGLQVAATWEEVEAGLADESRARGEA